ncbi:MAG: TonB-dependent receptor [Chitinophagaceae bacterium]|jgi:iron complex outermembrane receptor protein|nr:TonB-dependent receptor [Chitinophagaceae bacterium]
MKHKILFFLFACGLCTGIFAQTLLKGKVVDAFTNQPLQGASISMSNTVGTVSGEDGRFAVDCKRFSHLRISYIGYEPYNYTIKNCNDELFIALTPLMNSYDSVEITAITSQKKSVIYQPVSISKLGNTELSRGIGLYLKDAININVPGVYMQSRAISSGQQFNLRGYGNGTRGTQGVGSNFDGQGYKVYLNGIPLTTAEGITVMDDIDFNSIGNVEIVKGPAGVLYGLAIAGIINLKIKKPDLNKTSLAQEVMFGNYGLRRYTTTFATAKENSSLLVNYGKQHSDGFMTHTASDKEFINVAGAFQLNPKQSLTAYFGYSNSYDQRAGEDSIAEYDTNPFGGNIQYIMRNGHSKIISFRAGAEHTYNFSDKFSNTTSVFGTGMTGDNSSASGWTDANSLNYGLRSTFSTKFTIGENIHLNGLTGIETQQQRAQSIGYTMVQSPLDTNTYTASNVWKTGNPYYVIGASTSNRTTATATTSIFTEWTLSLPQDFSVVAGIGASNMHIELNDRLATFTATRPTHFDTSYNFSVSPHVALNKVFGKQFSVYAAYSKAYKMPVSSYFYIAVPQDNSVSGQTVPASAMLNSVLKPEVGNQFEIGSKGATGNGKLMYELAIFNTIFSNKMTTVAVANAANNATLYSYVANGGKVDNKGVEASLRYVIFQSNSVFFQKITPFVNYTFSDFKYKDFKFQSAFNTTIDYSGNQVPDAPKNVFNAGADFRMLYGIYVNATYSYRDGTPITSTGLASVGGVNIPYHLGSYNLLGAKAGIQQKLSKHFDMNVYFGVDNITKTKYPTMIFTDQLPDALIPAAPNAIFYGGVNLKYVF